VRNPAKASSLQSSGVTLFEGDLENTSALQRLIQNCDVVIHAAGAVRGNCQEDFDKVNVAGTRAVIQATKTSSPSAILLLLSSLAASQPQLSWYASSKRTGEDLLAQEALDLSWIAIRPPAVYGPGDKEMLPVFQTMAKGFATVPGTLESRISVIHVADLVPAIVACLNNAASLQGQVLTLCDGQPQGYSWPEIAAIAEQVFSRRVRLWQVPAPLLNTIANVNIASARLSHRAAMLTPKKLQELRHTDWVVDNQAITAATGWTPTIPLAQGIAQLGL